MAIQKRFIHFKKFSDFNSKKLSANEANTQYTVGISGVIQNGEPDVLYQSYCWIKDTQQQWTHGQLYNGKDTDLATVATSGSYDDLTNKPTIPDISGKQDKLVSGTNIKTINGESILGEGDLTIEGGAKIYEWFCSGDSESVTLSQEEYDNIVEADLVVVDFGGVISFTASKTSILFSEELGMYLLTGQFDFQESKMYIQIEINIATKLATITCKEQNIPTQTSQLENNSNFVSSDRLKTINGESIVGSGDIVIESGGSIPVVEVSGTSVVLTANQFTILTNGQTSTLTVTLNAVEDSSIYNEYMMQFSTGIPAPTVNFPSSVVWVETPVIEASRTYQVSIVDNKGIICSWERISLISFTIDGVTYFATQGMTWGEWVESDYNTGGFYKSDTRIAFSTYLFVDTDGDGYVNTSQTIQENYAYKVA